MARQPLKQRSQRRFACWLLAGGVALAMRSWGLLPLDWSCPLRELTGVPCPTCFLTRSMMGALRGDLPASLHWHPLGIPLLVAGAGLTALLWMGRLSQPRRLWPLAASAGGLIAAVWLIRLWGWLHGAPLPG